MLNIDLVSPECEIFENKKAEYLKIPSVKGELTILPGHRQSVILLSKGLMDFGAADKYIIYNGILEILEDDKINVIAERIKNISEIDKKQAQQQLKEVEAKMLQKTLSDKEYFAVVSEYTDCIAELTAF